MDLTNSIITYFSISIEDAIFYFLISPVIILWIWSILWVTRDISKRTDSLFFQVISILLVSVGTPFIWFPLYFVIRPSKFLFDEYWRESVQVLSIQCLECGTFNYKDNAYCTECGKDLKIKCKECWEKYYNWHGYCNVCGAPNID